MIHGKLAAWAGFFLEVSEELLANSVGCSLFSHNNRYNRSSIWKVSIHWRHLKWAHLFSGIVRVDRIRRQTQMMSNIGVKRTFAQAMRQLYSMGGMRAYYRGLTVSLSFIYMNVDTTSF